MKDPDQWVAMPILRNIAVGAARRGADLTVLCAAAGLSPEALQTTDAPVSLAANIALMEKAATLTGDDFLGLHLGEVSSPVVLGMVGHLMECSPDLRSAFRQMEQFNRVFTRIFEFRTEESDGEFRLYCEPIPAWHNASPETARQAVEISLAGMLHVVKLLTGRNLYPQRVLLRFGRPPDVSEYLRVLKTEPIFRQSCNCVVYRLRDLDAPVIGYNRELNLLFTQLLEKELARQQPGELFVEEVKRLILRKFQVIPPQLPEVAEALHLTPRTLQRKLKEEGTTFQKIVEGVRMDLAGGLLSDARVSINEVAYKLGYAEPGVFRRAFRQWTGQSPSAFKAAMRP